MVHIDPATLRRHPILGVIIGGAAAIFIGYLLQVGMTEARLLLRQKTPDAVSVHEAVTLRSIRWIAVSQGQWHCERAITIERPVGLERWLMGPIRTTEVPITGTLNGEILVACFDGAVACEGRAGSPLTGVVGSTEIFTSRSALRRWGRSGDRVAVLNVGASPRYALIMLVALVAIAVGGVVFAAYYLTLMLPRGGRHPVHASSHEPIQPN
jgi:hypothetical protein